MLAVGDAMLQAVDIAVLLLGGAVAVGAAGALLRSGRWRNPLAGVPADESAPSLAAVFLVVAVFIVLGRAAGRVAVPGGLPEAALRPGTDGWHRLQLADEGTDLLVSLLMGVILLAGRARPGRRPDVRTGLAVALLATLALLPVLTVQFQMGLVLWRWARPAAEPPLHVVLQALRDSAWGAWGVAQLVVGAVLVAPLVEELFFRGVLLGALRRHLGRAWPAIGASGGLFGLMHLTQPQDVLPLATMGVVLGYVRVRWGALWPCVLAHMLFNARTIGLVLLAPELLPAELRAGG